MLINIQKGDIVDIVFPASSSSLDEILAIKNYIKNELDLTPRILFENELIFAQKNPENEFPVNDKKQRFLQLKKALENPDSKIVWCGRGGYGSGDLLPFLKEIKKIKQNKLFIGFSDIVSIATFFQDNWGWNLICAPVLIQLARNEIEKSAKTELKELIFGKRTEFSYDLIALNKILESMKSNINIFNVVLMDYQMPNMDGPTSVKHMRDAGYNGLIIGITGNALPADLKYFKDQGANEVLTKPVKMSQLEDIIKNVNL